MTVFPVIDRRDRSLAATQPKLVSVLNQNKVDDGTMILAAEMKIEA